MSKHKKLVLKSFVFTVVTASVTSTTALAYQQGKGKIASIGKDEKIEKIDTVTTENNDERITGDFNRSGDPVRIIWYEDDLQTGANNQGQIHGKVIATGKDNTDPEERAGALAIDGQGNGIDALGWSAPSNPNHIDFTLTSIENSGHVLGEAELAGGKAETHADIQTFGSANGISVIGMADFGKSNAVGGADGTIDGYSGATGVVSRVKASSRVRVTSTKNTASNLRPTDPKDISPPPADTTEVDKYGKNVKVTLQQLTNSGDVVGKMVAKADQTITNPYLTTYQPQFYSTTAIAAGNGVSLASYVNTIDRYTYSEDKENKAELGNTINSGMIAGQAHLEGGKNATHTYTNSSNTGNGISVFSKIGNNAKHATYATMGNVSNSGKIIGQLTQYSGDNSGYRSIHLDANAQAYSGGNGIAVSADSYNYNVKETHASLGNIDNTGKIHGSASIKAGKGTGSISAKSYSSGNGLSTYAHGKNNLASIGNVKNAGIISGQIEVQGGANKGETFTAKITEKETYKRPSFFDWPPRSSSSSNHIDANIHSETEVQASGNGISAWTYSGKDAKLGNIDNLGVISGNATVFPGFSQNSSSRVDFRNNGNGITVNQDLTSNITNAGIISGSHSAILAKGLIDDSYSVYKPEFTSGIKGQIENYGILAGRMILGNFQAKANEDQGHLYFEGDRLSINKEGLPNVKNAGLYVRLDEAGKIKSITTGSDTTSFSQDGQTYTVINAPLNDSKLDSSLTATDNYTHHIINGVGQEKGALSVTDNRTLANSIINGYHTALHLDKNANVALNNTTLNANGFGNTFALKGDDNPNHAVLSNRSRLNGNTHFNGGDDTLTIQDSSVKINGQFIDMGAGQDTITFGKSASEMALRSATTPIKIDYNILNAESLVVNQDTFLSAYAKVKGTDKVTINSNLIYQIIEKNQHALYDTNRTEAINLNGEGNFIVDIAQSPADYEIDFGGFSLLNPENKVKVKTTSVVQTAKLQDGKLIINPKQAVDPEPVIPVEPEVVQPTAPETADNTNNQPTTVTPQPEVVQPTAPETADNTNNQPTTVTSQPEIVQPTAPKKAENVFVTPYKDVYESYITSWQKTGKDFLADSGSILNKSEDHAYQALNRYFADTTEHNLYGAVPVITRAQLQAYRQATLDSTHKRLKAYDVEVSAKAINQQNKLDNTAEKSRLNAMLTTIRYGISDDTTIGLAFGTGKTKLKGYSASQLSGHNFYTSGYLTQAMTPALSLTAGVAYQKAQLKGTRNISNDYDQHSFETKADNSAMSVYTQLQYAIPLSQTWQTIPTATIAYSRLKQDAIYEMGNAGLNMPGTHFNSVEATIGQDLTGTFATLQGKWLLSLSTHYRLANQLNDLTATFQQGKDFSIHTEKDRQAFDLGANVRYAFNNGLDLKLGTQNTMKKSGNTWTTQVGLGYTF